jgi:CRISPR-associated protein Cas2
MSGVYDLVCMYVIAVYDVQADRTQKMLKICRRYLNWIQNSTLEGELTELQLNELVDAALKVMDPATDSLILFKNRNAAWLERFYRPVFIVVARDRVV